MKKIVVLLALFVLTVATVAHADQTLAKPGVLNEETVTTPNRLSTYDTLVIREFYTDGVFYENVDDEEKPKVDALRPLIARNLTESLQSEMAKRKLFKNVVLNSDSAGNAVIIEGNFTEFNGGSRALRFWVGFGAGKTYLKVKGRMIDAKTGKELASFVDQETGYKGVASMESFEDLFPHQATSLGENIGEFIQRLY